MSATDDLTKLEQLWLLRRLRAMRDSLVADRTAVEERIRAGHDGELNAAWRALDADIAIADEVIRKLHLRAL